MEFITAIFDLVIAFLQGLLNLVQAFFNLIIGSLQGLLNLFS